MHPRTKTVTVKQMRRFLNRKEEKQREYDALNAEYRKICKKYEQKLANLEHQLRIAYTITYFWGNISVSVEDYVTRYGKGMFITDYGDDLKRLRQIDIYPNAHTSENGKAKHWHINIQAWLSDGASVYNGGKAFLYNATSIKALMPIAREFIENGTVPKES